MTPNELLANIQVCANYIALITLARIQGRIGSQYAQSRIFSEVLNGYEPAFEPYKGYAFTDLGDDIDKWRFPVADSIVKNNMSYQETEPQVKSLIDKRHKTRMNLTEWEKKMPRRVENLFLLNAKDKPFVNMGERPDADLVPLRFEDFTKDEQYKLAVAYPKNMAPPKPSMTDYIASSTDKQVEPYAINNFNAEDEFNFIQKGRGKDFVVKSNNNAIDVMGSTIAIDYARDENQEVGPRTEEEIYKAENDDVTKPNINRRQNQNFKSRQLLGVYSGEPTKGGSAGSLYPTNVNPQARLMDAIERQRMRENRPLRSKRQ